MKFLAGLLVGVIILAMSGFAFVYSGAYNVAATEPHTPFGTWLLGAIFQHSVKVRAGGIATPGQFTDEDVQQGFQSFNTMCVPCHGAPGKERNEIGKGLYPEPPDLGHAPQHWSSAELFWIVKHGLRMTGMPAFGPTHEDRQLWNIVAFVQRLPDMTPDRYNRMEEETGLSPSEHRH
jgi:mono/diheme cytochrome c family protein